MEENVLIKSEFDQKARNLILAIAVCALVLSAFVFIIFAVTEAGEYYSSYFDEYYYRYDNVYESAFDFDDGENIMHFIIFVLACLSLVAGILLLIVYWVRRKCEITITEKNVRGRTLFGKEVVLPLYMVSSYSTRTFMSTIAIATSSGITAFSFVGNYAEIGNVLSQKINERQENTVNQPIANTAASQGNPMDDLKKLKELFDAGIITQEEFDAKKKQLLGL